jgi:hypothetical protein
MDAQLILHGDIGTPPQPLAQASRARPNPAAPSSRCAHRPRCPVPLDWRCRMQPEAPAALARTGLVVVACWVLNAPVLLAIRVLGTCGPCCVVPPDRPGTRSTFLPSPLTRHSLLAQATSPIERARRRRPACPHPSLGSVSSHRSAPSRPVLTRSVLCHVWSCGFRLVAPAMSLPCLLSLPCRLSCFPHFARALSYAYALCQMGPVLSVCQPNRTSVGASRVPVSISPVLTSVGVSVLMWFLIRVFSCVVAHCSALVVLIAPVELEAAIPLLCPYLVEISLFRTKLS